MRRGAIAVTFAANKPKVHFPFFAAAAAASLCRCRAGRTAPTARWRLYTRRVNPAGSKQATRDTTNKLSKHGSSRGRGSIAQTEHPSAWHVECVAMVTQPTPIHTRQAHPSPRLVSWWAARGEGVVYGAIPKKNGLPLCVPHRVLWHTVEFTDSRSAIQFTGASFRDSLEFSFFSLFLGGGLACRNRATEGSFWWRFWLDGCLSSAYFPFFLAKIHMRVKIPDNRFIFPFMGKQAACNLF